MLSCPKKKDPPHHDDLAWAKPLVDEALAGVDRGEVMTRAEHRARMDARLSTVKDQ